MLRRSQLGQRRPLQPARHLLGKWRPGSQAMYRRADALNPRDSELLSNLGVASIELDQPRAALRAYRRALELDPHNVNARVNAAELLLERGRLSGLKLLLAQAPNEVLQHEALQHMAAEEQRMEGKRRGAQAQPAGRGQRH